MFANTIDTVSGIQVIIDTLVEKPASNFNSISTELWDDIVVTAIVLGLAPLLHWRLEQQKISLPPMAMAKLAVTRQAHAKRNKAIANQLTEILAACRHKNIAVMVLKGALLAETAYLEPGLRPMNDIDLLFQPDDLPLVAQLLENLGYEGKYKDAAQGPGVTKHLSTYRRAGNEGDTPNPYLSAGGDRMIEPHGSLEESWFGLKVDITPGVWDRAVSVNLHGQPALRLSTSDLLLHLSVHAAFHVIMGASVFVQLYDIGRVIDTWSTEINWSQLVELTRQTHAQPFVYAGLYWAQSLYRANVPAQWLQTLKHDCSPDLLDYIHGFNATTLLKRTQQPPLTTMTQRLKRGLADRRNTARWAASTAGKWRVWQTALALHKTDTASLLLGRPAKTEM